MSNELNTYVIVNASNSKPVLDPYNGSPMFRRTCTYAEASNMASRLSMVLGFECAVVKQNAAGNRVEDLMYANSIAAIQRRGG